MLHYFNEQIIADDIPHLAEGLLTALLVSELALPAVVPLALVNLPWLLLGIDIMQLDVVRCAVVGLRVSEHTKPAHLLSGRAGDGTWRQGGWGPEAYFRHSGDSLSTCPGQWRGQD